MNEKAVEALADLISRERSALPISEVQSGFALLYRAKAREYLEVAEKAMKEEEDE